MYVYLCLGLSLCLSSLDRLRLDECGVHRLSLDACGVRSWSRYYEIVGETEYLTKVRVRVRVRARVRVRVEGYCRGLNFEDCVVGGGIGERGRVKCDECGVRGESEM